MRNLLLIASFFILACSNSDDDLPDDYFLCTVDYVEFVDDSNAIVKFETTLGDLTHPFYGRYTYTKEGNNYFIGDDLVNITNFSQKGNEATFVFEYGENLGFFCASIFEALPAHVHYTFDAEAAIEITAKGVGRWKIKKKSNLRQ